MASNAATIPGVLVRMIVWAVQLKEPNKIQNPLYYHGRFHGQFRAFVPSDAFLTTQQSVKDLISERTFGSQLVVIVGIQ